VEGNERSYTARIAATENNVAEATRSLQVRAGVIGDKAGLVPGNFARVILNFDPDHNAIMIPSQAIIPQARGKKVYIIEDGKAKFVEVQTGLRDSSYVQITSGLKPGDTVLVTGLLSLKPEGKVTVGKVINATKGTPTADTTVKKNTK
jgi:membrane fusion protein (multidrug efflux system)